MQYDPDIDTAAACANAARALHPHKRRRKTIDLCASRRNEEALELHDVHAVLASLVHEVPP